MAAPDIELICLGLFAAMLCFLEIGRQIGRRLIARHREKSEILFPSLEAAVFGLMGLVVAFTVSGAALRFEMKRDLIVQEANAIGTAWLRIDLLPPSRQSALRESFRWYADSRLTFHSNLTDETVARQALGRSVDLQRVIWSEAVNASGEAPVGTNILVISS